MYHTLFLKQTIILIETRPNDWSASWPWLTALFLLLSWCSSFCGKGVWHDMHCLHAQKLKLGMPACPPTKAHTTIWLYTRMYMQRYVEMYHTFFFWNKPSYWLQPVQMVEVPVDRDLPLCFFFFHDVPPSVEEECGMICIVYMHRSWNLECLHAPPLKHIQLYDFTHVCTWKGMLRCTILFSFETNHHFDWNPSKWLKCQLTVTYRFVSFSFMMFLLLWKRSVAWYALFTCTEAETWNACMPPPLKHIQLYDFTHICTCKGMLRCTTLFSWNKPSYWLKPVQMIEVPVDRDLPLCFFFFHDVPPSVEKECGMICIVYMHRSWNLECLHAPPLKPIQLYDFTHICTCKGMLRCTTLFSWNKPSYWLKPVQMIEAPVDRDLTALFLFLSWCSSVCGIPSFNFSWNKYIPRVFQEHGMWSVLFSCRHSKFRFFRKGIPSSEPQNP